MNILRKNNRGFTLVEFISVLLIMGIVAAVVVSRVGTSDNEVIAQIEVIKSHLRYAQSRTMNSDKKWGVRFDTSRYWLFFKDGNITPKVTFPGEDPNEDPNEDPENVSLPSGMSVGDETVLFGDWGKPYIDASGGTPQSAGRTIVFLPSLTNHAIIITKNTGFIE